MEKGLFWYLFFTFSKGLSGAGGEKRHGFSDFRLLISDFRKRE
jgi:hypothetical protein